MSFAFGTPSSAPATGLTSGFNFGANKPATPGFGLATTQSAGVFGTPTSSTSGFGATPAFGATPSFGSAPAFGTTTPGFGATTAAPAFGATATPTFGATSTAPAFGSTPAPAFGSTAATPAFGAAAPAFGSTPAPSFGTGLGTGGLNFGAGTNTSTAAGLLTGTQAQSTATPGLGGLGGFGFGSSTSASTGFNLLGSTNTATTTSSFFGSKPGVTSTTGTQPTTSTTPSLGLGGIAPNASGAANTTTSGDGKSESPKQTKLPNEISTTVNSFEEFVKKQKAMSSEIMRVSIKPLHQVARSAEALQRALGTADSGVRRARGAAARLRARSAALAAAADRAKHAAAGCEAEEGAPAFMLELLAELARQLAALRRLTGAASDQLRPAAPRAPAELTDGIRRMHEGVIGLAARLQAAHARVQARAAHYRQLRARTAPGDSDGVLHSLDAMLHEVEAPSKKTRAAHESLGAASLAGPTPFACLAAPFPPLPPAPPAPAPPGSGWNSSGGLCGLTARGVAEPAPFALQKPPGKRGKQ